MYRWHSHNNFLGELGKATIPQVFLVNTIIQADGKTESQLVFHDSPNDHGGILERKLCSLLNIEPDEEGWVKDWEQRRNWASVRIQKTIRGHQTRTHTSSSKKMAPDQAELTSTRSHGQRLLQCCGSIVQINA
eukprot:COSAG01_NODE_2493_length_7581_cov_126.097167_3_plen_133_part_00